MDIETRTCECCEEDFEVAEDSDEDYCDSCNMETAIDLMFDRRYRRAESGYPDA